MHIIRRGNVLMYLQILRNDIIEKYSNRCGELIELRTE